VLAVRTYPKAYITECHAQMVVQLDAYRRLTAAAAGGNGATRVALEVLEPILFNNLVIVLDSYFTYRTRGIEGKDGNPLNEVRMLSHSLRHGKGRLLADSAIKYRPEKTVLKLQIGDEIRLDPGRFHALFEAYFAEIKRRFG
jgi:hypothetical protein